jgi:hypothetical protein
MQVVWQNRKGAGCMRSFANVDDCIAFISKLHCEATVYNDQHEKIGSVEPNDGRHDDKRVKWLWWIER